MSNVRIGNARNGKGIFAERDFKKGEEIYCVKGRLITCNEDDDLDEKTRDNAFRFDEERYVDPTGEIGVFQNHSCDPSAAVFKKNRKLFVVAVRPIEKGEEITIDYSTITGSDDSWEMRCNCGTAACRTRIKNIRALPAALKRRYRGAGMIPNHIR